MNTSLTAAGGKGILSNCKFPPVGTAHAQVGIQGQVYVTVEGMKDECELTRLYNPGHRAVYLIES